MSIIYTILIFAVIIFIHELGHFTVAKLCKVRVNEFSLGMGPTILKKQGKTTLYSLRLLPIGGYVSLEGEDDDSDDPNSFVNQSKLKRTAILIAGAVMNLVLGFVIMLCINAAQPVYNSATVARFLPNATTEATGLEVGDRIVKMNKTTILNDKDIIFEILRDSDAKVDMQVIRNGKRISLEGVQFDVIGESVNKEIRIDFNVLGVKRTFFSAFDYTFKNTVSLARNSWVSIGDMLSGKININELSGPVGVGQVVDEATGIGASAVFMLAAFITISVGMFNLLPFPALDGGRIILLLVEAIRKKPISRKVENAINGIGFILLMGLTIFITFKDIIKLF